MRHLIPLCLMLVATLGLRAADAEGPLAKELEPLRPLLGKTWRGEFKASTPENPLVDVARWERALNGQAVRILHSINDGIYGGETIIRWNADAGQIEFHYFTTAGFMTQGTIRAENGKFTTHEKVVGTAGGVSEVKGVFEVSPGKYKVSTQHLKDGAWSAGREVLYVEAPDAKVNFK